MTSPRKLLEYLTENYCVFDEPTLLEIGIHELIKKAVGDDLLEKTSGKLSADYTHFPNYKLDCDQPALGSELKAKHVNSAL